MTMGLSLWQSSSYPKSFRGLVDFSAYFMWMRLEFGITTAMVMLMIMYGGKESYRGVMFVRLDFTNHHSVF